MSQGNGQPAVLEVTIDLVTGQSRRIELCHVPGWDTKADWLGTLDELRRIETIPGVELLRSIDEEEIGRIWRVYHVRPDVKFEDVTSEASRILASI